MNKEKFISKMLCLPPTAIEYHISQRLAKFFPDKALIKPPRKSPGFQPRG